MALTLSVSSIYRAVRNGEMRAVRLADGKRGALRIPTSELLRLSEARVAREVIHEHLLVVARMLSGRIEERELEADGLSSSTTFPLRAHEMWIAVIGQFRSPDAAGLTHAAFNRERSKGIRDGYPTHYVCQ